jgi:hypothetical protein
MPSNAQSFKKGTERGQTKYFNAVANQDMCDKLIANIEYFKWRTHQELNLKPSDP